MEYNSVFVANNFCLRFGRRLILLNVCCGGPCGGGGELARRDLCVGSSSKKEQEACMVVEACLALLDSPGSFGKDPCEE
jgi:hypothetical protein